MVAETPMSARVAIAETKGVERKRERERERMGCERGRELNRRMRRERITDSW